MYTAALNRIVCLAGPFQLTSLWQANDAGTNQKFKLILGELIEPQVTLKLTFSSGDMASYIVEALKHPDMPRAICNSF